MVRNWASSFPPPPLGHFISKRKCTMASWTRCLVLLFDIVATVSDTFLIACNQFEESTLVKFSGLRYKELSHSQFQSSLVLEMTSRNVVSIQRTGESPLGTLQDSHKIRFVASDRGVWMTRPIARILPIELGTLGKALQILYHF